MERLRAFRCVMTILVAAVLAEPAEAQFSYQDLPVESVRFEADSELDPSPLYEVLTIKAGEPLSIVGLQTSIKALFATGNFRDIRVDGERVGEGIRLTFRVSLHYRIGEIEYEIDGQLPDRARREVTIEEEQILSLNRVDQIAVDMTRALRRNGYLEATVDPEVRFRRQENLASVIFHVSSGPKARIESIEFEGVSEPFTRETLLAQMESEIGGPFETARARDDAGRVRRFLLREGYRMAEVSFEGEAYDSETSTVDLSYELDVGPPVEVEVEGVERSASDWTPRPGRST
ncbi:MAG: POTRA domain-containing protein, partial [Thermoanaerobaculia bacterium]|nr:POTRA domain-containing protein [Thermoanaerobaculia bacterium]